MATPYSDIFKSFKKRIEDKDLPKFSEQEQEEMMIEWLDSAIAYIELDGLKLKNDLSSRDDDFQEFNADLEKFEIEIIAMYMVVAWYEPKINSLEHTLMFIGSKDEKWTSQKEHMDMMVNARNKIKIEAKKYFRNYGYRNNAYLGGEG